MRRRILWATPLLLAAAMTAASCNRSESEADAPRSGAAAKPSSPGSTDRPEPRQIRPDASASAPAFTLADQDGRQVSLADFAGKVVVLEWLNPDCPYVQRHYQAKTMVNLANKYRPKGVVWLAINSTHYWDQQKNKEWHTKQSLPYPVLGDHAGKVGRSYGAKTTPHMFIVDASGALAYRGAIDDDASGARTGAAVNYVDRALTEILGGGKPSVPETRQYGCSVKYAK